MWSRVKTKRLMVLGVVAAGVFAVLWLKPSAAPEVEGSGAQVRPATAEPDQSPAAVAVLLFADPREAESSCVCAEVIRLARGASEMAGVTTQEFDTRRRDARAERYGVRVSPTVIIAGKDGTEQTRFEGESDQVIARLRTAIDALAQRKPAPGVTQTR